MRPSIFIFLAFTCVSAFLLAACAEDKESPPSRASRSEERRAAALVDRPASASIATVEAAKCRAAGDLDGALRQYERALSLDPQFAVVRLLSATLLLEQGENERALQACDFVLKADPDDAAAYEVRGQVRQALGRFDEAQADFEESLAIKPSERVLLRLRELKELQSHSK